MYKEFLLEIARKATADQEGAIQEFRTVMQNLPDNVVINAFPTAALILKEINDHFQSDPDNKDLLKGFSVMYSELAKEIEKRMAKEC